MGVERLGTALKFVFLILMAAYPVAGAISYSFQVGENGETSVEIQLTESAQINLPKDVTQPDIEGGSTKALNNGLTYVDTANAAEVTYLSSYYTKKEQGVWQFEANIPRADDITLTLPQSVHVVQSQPRATFTKIDRWQLSWQNLTGDVTVSYVSVNQASALPILTLPNTSNMMLFYIVLAIAILGATYYIYKRRSKDDYGKPNITNGQLNILRAANPNEALVLKIMLKYNGRIKRNQLEKESQLSKSSLASVLKILERKNIINIDRTFQVHYITLTPWFNDLK